MSNCNSEKTLEDIIQQRIDIYGDITIAVMAKILPSIKQNKSTTYLSDKEQEQLLAVTNTVLNHILNGIKHKDMDNFIGDIDNFVVPK